MRILIFSLETRLIKQMERFNTFTVKVNQTLNKSNLYVILPNLLATATISTATSICSVTVGVSFWN